MVWKVAQHAAKSSAMTFSHGSTCYTYADSFFSLLLMVFFVFFFSPFLKQSTLFACKKYYNTPPARSNACIFAFHPHLNIVFFCIIFRDSQRFFFDINIFSTSFFSSCSLRFFIVRYLSLVLSTSLSRVTHFPVLKSPFPAILSLSPIITSPSPILISPYPALVSSFLALLYFSPVLTSPSLSYIIFLLSCVSPSPALVFSSPALISSLPIQRS
jgi:hypothetical protein